MESKIKEFYKKLLFLYGFLSILRLLSNLIEEEEYEECQLLVKVIEEVNKDFKLEIPTIYCDEAVYMFEESYLEVGDKKNRSRIEEEDAAINAEKIWQKRINFRNFTK